MRKIYILIAAACLQAACCISQEKVVEVNGVSLAYEVSGEGSPVVLLHGNGGSHHDLDTLSAQLVKAGYKVYALDSRGQGANAPLSEYHYADMAEDVFQFCEKLGLRKPAVFGWSDGGIVALELEIAHPGTVRKMMVCGANVTTDFAADPEGWNAYLAENADMNPLVRMMRDEPTINRSELASISCPVLVCAGQHDLISEAHTRHIANSIPGSRLMLVPGEDHISYILNNPRAGVIFLDFLENFGEPRIHAHRGGRYEQEENTLEAFAATYETGCSCYETDVHITSDGELVIMHDGNVARMTDGEGDIETMTADEIRALTTKGGHKVPFLKDLVDFFNSKGMAYVEFEMKTTDTRYYDQSTIEKYCDAIYRTVMKDKPAESTYLFTSFDERPLLYLQSKYPDADLLLISGSPCTKELVDHCVSLGISRLGCTVDGTTRAGVRYAHHEGLFVTLWPGGSVEDSILAAALGADQLCTDIPAEVISYIKAHDIPIRYR